MKSGFILGVLLASVLLWTGPASAQQMDANLAFAEKDEGPDVAWFRDAKFGVFVHWGVSSRLGGQWNGENFYGITEWVWNRAKASRAEYLRLLETFDPKGYNADEWVALAKEAGAKYMVVTAKHHDGIAMFDTDASPYDIMDGAPFGRDAMQELAVAARKQDMKLGFYYSQFLDWAHPHAGGNTWEYNAADQDFSIYQREKAIPQLNELLTNYGDVAIIWFDTPGNISPQAAQDFLTFVRERQPNALVSSRIGHGLGDYQTYGDSVLPVVHSSSRPFEAIFPHNVSWGYSALDHNFKSTTRLLHILAESASKGGNFLLNAGPDGDGRIPEETQRRFREIGAWLNVNGEAIYQTTASPYSDMPWGVFTQRPGRLYAHVLHPPKDGRILVPDTDLTVRRAKLLDGGRRLRVTRTAWGLEVVLPDTLPDARNTVIVFEHDGATIAAQSDEERRVRTISRQHDQFVLEPELAKLSGGTEIEIRRYWHYPGEGKHYPSVKGFKDTGDQVTWTLNITEPGDYRVLVMYAANASQAGREGIVRIAGQERLFRVLETGDHEFWQINSFRPVATLEDEVGNITIPAPGTYDLSLVPAQDGEDELMFFRRVVLLPQD